MRLTVRIADDLHAAARAHAAKTGRTPLKLPTFGKAGLRPGVSLDDTAGLLDAMEGRDRRR